MNTSSEKTAKILGYGGLIPFIGLAILEYLEIFPYLNIRAALLFYGAIILSFVGALHWAFAMTLENLSSKQQSLMFIWSVIPALIAWFSLLCPTSLSAILQIIGFALQLWQDFQLKSKLSAVINRWFFSLRIQLSLIASLSLLTLLIKR